MAAKPGKKTCGITFDFAISVMVTTLSTLSAEEVKARVNSYHEYGECVDHVRERDIRE
jgi:hypothetical protein